MSTTTALVTGLTAGLAALGLLVAGLLRAVRDLQHRVLTLESAAARRRPGVGGTDPATAPPAAATGPASLQAAPELSDVVPVVGTTPDGDAVEVALDEGPWLVAFLSTSCSICVDVWTRMAQDGLRQVDPTVRAVVVTKDAGKEDVEQVVRVQAGSELPVVLSTEAWSDYEIPGSPYLLLLDGTAGRLVSEGPVRGWDDVVRMVRKLATA